MTRGGATYSRATMSQGRRLVVSAVATAALAITLTARVGSSQPAARFPTEQPAPLAARVALLEQRVHQLERRGRVFERVGVASRPGGAISLAVNGASVVIAANGSVSVTPAASPRAQTPTSAAAPDCDPPYAIDARGLRSVKPECMQAECDPPYTVDADGIRRPKPGCE